VNASARAAVVALAIVLGGCGHSARDDARETLVKQLEDGGLDHRTAECVVTTFFAGKTDDELQGFFQRPQLTPEEAAEFAALGEQCKSG